MSLTVARSVAEDPERLAPYLRQVDRDEVMAAVGIEPLEALRIGYDMSADPQTIVAEDGVPVAMFGVTPIAPGIGSPWLLGSGLIEERWVEFVRRSRDEFHRLRADWGLLTNFIDERHTSNIRWLRWLGFHMAERVPHYGVGRLPFIRFEWSQES